MLKNHQFHLVDPSPWPMIISFIILNYTSFSILFFNTKKTVPMTVNLILIAWVMFIWWRDIHRESTFQGLHTFSVVSSMKYGMMLFITSEVLFFVSFFWSFFHHSLSPTHEMGMLWPPFNIESFNPLNIPLMNTIILLSSGVSVTWAHVCMCSNNYKETNKSLLITILLGIYFSFLQFYEYSSSPFSISDSVYGSTFFVTTGFHGIHVLIGTLFLIHALTRMKNLHFSSTHHLGMELAIWYWHFVDVVWLFLYITIYWWGK
uniref:Cytochrome c oxidase subunit 3 n=1 Tax=Bactericera cockerelli TaxID=290155 RepID=A0A166GKR6_9HEMI|nr:cytochrome c oxidase subunit III [Bactericera cockerelli]ANA07529.1 cytochrome c oxidase subunit III [Bactericera cockerelli]APC60514.1 cytochrome c oxidase subunit III [Bactericera cockerelli]APC60521.1 cytochrome c oxidase subunit III [Bactericera cockerelli]APC60535.1 cytochrome c oxidase subunit III [Bactericera cockerelli]APC60542.1 cytochrome c oxidase subunit III [Bactericera cockerelli]